MSSFDPAALAHEIKAAQNHAGELIPFTSHYADFDLAAAYDVAHRVHALRLAEGAVPVGRKIGFTNPEMWDLYGVRAPVWAHVFDGTVVSGVRGTARCKIDGFVAPKIEPEIVVHFHSQPPASADPTELLACIDWIAHGIEIVQSHFPNWKFQAADTVADQALHATLLVGPPCPTDRLGPNPITTLEAFSVTLSCNGRVVETGYGRNVLGSPLNAVSHLLQVIAQMGAAPVRAGEIITTGTITKAHAIQIGEVWGTEFEGIALPGLRIAFER